MSPRYEHNPWTGDADPVIDYEAEQWSDQEPPSEDESYWVREDDDA